MASIVLAGTGFSSWQVGGSSNLNNHIATNIGSVIPAGDYISFSEPSLFEYCKFGAIKDGEIVDFGEIIVNFKIFNIKQLLQNIDYSDGISIRFDFSTNDSNPNFNLFTYMQNACLYGFASSEDNLVLNNTGNLSINNSSSEIILNCNDSNLYTALNIYSSIKFTFSFSSVMNTFETSIYDNLSTSNIVFSCEVLINE